MTTSRFLSEHHYQSFTLWYSQGFLSRFKIPLNDKPKHLTKVKFLQLSHQANINQKKPFEQLEMQCLGSRLCFARISLKLDSSLNRSGFKTLRGTHLSEIYGNNPPPPPPPGHIRLFFY